MNPNALAPIMQLLPLMLILPMVQGMFGGGKKNLQHSPARNAGKIVAGVFGLAGGFTAGVVSPILLATLTPPKITDPATVDSPAKAGDYINLLRKAQIASGLTAAIGGGVSGVANGAGVILAKA